MTRTTPLLILALSALPPAAWAHRDSCDDPHEQLCSDLCDDICDGDDCDEGECDSTCQDHFEAHACRFDLFAECEDFCEDFCEDEDCSTSDCRHECNRIAHDILDGGDACYPQYLLPRLEYTPRPPLFCPQYPSRYDLATACVQRW